MKNDRERAVLSEKTRRCLQQAGWSPGRRVDITAYERALVAEGYSLSEAARAFLEEFGGLTVLHPHHMIPGRTDTFHLDPVRAAAHIFPEHVTGYEKRVGESLVVIGEAYRENMVLTMSESGKVYAGRDDTLVRLGMSGGQALETLCEGIQANKVWMP